MAGPMPFSFVSVPMALLRSGVGAVSMSVSWSMTGVHSLNACIDRDLMSSEELEIASLSKLGRKVPCLLVICYYNTMQPTPYKREYVLLNLSLQIFEIDR